MAGENEVNVEQEFANEIQELRTKLETIQTERNSLSLENAVLRQQNAEQETRIQEAQAAGIRQGVRKALEIFQGFFPPA